MIVRFLSALLEILWLLLMCLVVLYADIWLFYIVGNLVAALMEGDNNAQRGQ